MKKIYILENRQIITLEESVNNTISLIKENMKKIDDNTYVWDLTKDKIEKSTNKFYNKKQAIKYFELFLEKMNLLPKSVKVKLTKILAISLLSLIGFSTISNIIKKEVPEIEKEVILDLEKELKIKNTLNNKIDTTTNNKIDTTKNEINKTFISPNKSSKHLEMFLKKEEGKIGSNGKPVLRAYSLGDGMITIGWGHAEPKNNSKFKIGQRISKKKAQELLDVDITEAEKAVNDIFKKWKKEGIEYYIDQNMYDAMVSMAFNMGRGGLWKSDFIQLIKKGKYEEAKNTIKNTHITYPGHIERRKKESNMFNKNLNNILGVFNKDRKNNEKEFISENTKNRLKLLSGI
jgi:GH24 family phage-related lysozyme (muramidase)